MNSLLSKYSEEIEAILVKYPPERRRSAVMPLIYLAQRETGYINKQGMDEVAEIVGITSTDVASIVGFYTLYHESPGGKYRLQVCTDLPCALRGADEFLAKLCENVGVHVGETSADGLIAIEEVTCLAGCHRAPLFQVQTGDGISYHENQTVESAMRFIDEVRQREWERGASR
ncbi:MAG TPA: NAD(P)H-dependent oxidoreductase subunit E [Anaerolineaceae bacterium]|nr:NAD(P)H-dependent oxidoreductase subunit E [Anaerolineaceae bacterium]